MFNDRLVDELLELFDLEEILEMNNLTDAEVLEILVREGLISEPERIVQEYEE